jgi:hypothetical protein
VRRRSGSKFGVCGCNKSDVVETKGIMTENNAREYLKIQGGVWEIYTG